MRKPVPFGRYLLLDRIAVGGMAEVFAAKTFGVEGFQRTLAIKRILPNMVEDDELITMFIDEARIDAVLTHGNIATIYELGQHDDTYFIAMEYVSGRDVRLLIDKFRKKNQTVPLPMAAYIVARIAEGLDYAHSKSDNNGQPLGIIHRDVSPQNVLVSYDGDVKLIDFGIAKAAGRNQKTQAGILKGKFAYMSPEQVRGIPIDNRSDIYSAGVILYEMITGSRLFSGESDFSTLEKVRAGTVRAPSELNESIPPQLERVVLKALAKERDDRYQGGSELHDDLMRYLFSGKNVYSGKNLGEFMRDAFADEFRKELERLRRWADTTTDDEDFQPEEASVTAPPPSKSRISSRDEPTVGGRSSTRPPPTRPPSRPAPRREVEEEADESEGDAQVEGMPTQVRSLDNMATQVRAMPTASDGATAIIRREDIQGEPEVPSRRERTVLLDEREILAVSRVPPRKKRGGRRIAATVTAAVAALALGLGVADLQIQKGQEGVLIVIKDAASAQASVDGTAQNIGSGAFIFRSPKADHSLKVSAAGYKPFESNFTLGSGRPVEVTLVKDTGPSETSIPSAPPPPVAAETPPSAVADNQAAARAPTARSDSAHAEAPKENREDRVAQAMKKLESVDSKTHVDSASAAPPAAVAVEQPRTDEVIRVPLATATQKQATQAVAPPVAPSKVSFSITTTAPPSAMVMVRVDGKPAGMKRTPVTIPALLPGQKVEMRFAQAGFEPLTKQYTITGANDAVSVALSPVGDGAAKTGDSSSPAKLKVMCYPRGQIVVDDKVVGHAAGMTATTLPVEPGKHQVACQWETGDRSAPKDLMLVAGDEQRYVARMNQ